MRFFYFFQKPIQKQCLTPFIPCSVSYSRLEEQDFLHDKNVLNGGLDIDNLFDSIYTLIFNVKRFIIGTYHGLKGKYLQKYLD